MYSYHFNICGLQYQLNTPLELWVEAASEAFRAGTRQPDVVADFYFDSAITPQAQQCGFHRERPVWRDGSRIYRGDHDLFRQEMHFCTEYDLNDPCHLICRVRREDWLWATRSKYLWPGMMLNCNLLHHRGMILHASCVRRTGKGILFVGPSGTGKSTQAELWRKHRGAQIINGDKAGITLRGAPMVHGVPFSGTSGICENDSLPLEAVVVLSQAPENTVCRLPASRAVSALCSNLFVDQTITEEWQLALNLLLDLVTEVPVWHLACTPDERAVSLLERTMEEASR